MGLKITTSNLWLPLLAMLLSASVTTSFVQPIILHSDLANPGVPPERESPVGLEYHCLNTLPGYAGAPAPPRSLEKPTDESMADVDFWERMRNGFDFPDVDPESIRTYISEYTRHPHLLAQLLHRGEPYLYHILNRLEQEGMPAELALLPVIESAFDPYATSPAGAAGIWQFMPATATFVGLGQDKWYDGRRDIIASTEAALDYLGQLHKRFSGDWLLTLAAYNAGGARVQRAIRDNRDAGRETDFWHLSLPSETRSYVPKLIALRNIIEQPREYNISLPAVANTRYFSIIEINGQIEFRVAARLAKISLHGLQRLNPGYERMITPPGKTHTLLVPKSVEWVFREHIARMPQEQRIQSIRHRIRKGDSLSVIAQQYRTTVSELREVNRLEGSKIIAGDLLIVPANKPDHAIAGNTHTELM